tara:strand:- start:116 stop:358 length:243 start_codon:yes stop_codon:yes gene_type:complete
MGGQPLSLLREVSESLEYYLDEYIPDHTRAEICFLRRKIIEKLAKGNINEETYHPKEHFWTVYMVNTSEIEMFYRIKIDH